MKLKKLATYSLMLISIGSLTGCASVSDFFRNRDFDYARNQVSQNPPLEIPKSISETPNINPTLVVPQGQTSFDKASLDNAYQSLLPPNFHSDYNVILVEQKQMHIVQTKLNYDKDNQAKLTIYEPRSLSFLIIENALKKDIKDIKLSKVEKSDNRFIIEDTRTKAQYYVFLASVKDQFRQTILSIFDMGEKPVTTKAGDALVKAIAKQIEGQKVTQSELVASQYGYINSQLGIKFQVYQDGDISSLVFVGKKDHVIDAILAGLKGAGLTYIAYNEKNGTILFKDKADQGYLLYTYDKTVNGSIFSDMGNWRNFFRKEQNQIRVSVFTTKEVLVPSKKAKPILQQIATHIPLVKPSTSTKESK